MLGPIALGRRQVGTAEQVLVHAHGPLVFATAPEQVAQGKVQIAGVGVLLDGLDEGVDRLVVLFVEQQIEALEVGLGCFALVATHLPDVEPGSQPSQRKGHRQAEQHPLKVKVHHEADAQAGRGLISELPWG